MCTKGPSCSIRPIKSLIKDNPSAVYESLLGIATTNNNLVVLENHCIIMRRDYKNIKGKVKIIGGGGAGIEPAESYFVGRGMLTAAVVGEIFTAPSAHEILFAIRELATDETDSILLLVKNYIGDKLNFVLAMNQALKENIDVKMLVISDDIYYHTPARYGKKGLAGSVLVYKIVGEMAEQGKMLEEIIQECKDMVMDDLATISATLVPCVTKACDSFNNFIGFEEIVLGMGIYGKGGEKKIKITELKELVALMLEETVTVLMSSCKEFKNNFVVLVNNFGGMTKLEEAVIAKEVSQKLKETGFTISKIYTGTFMSSMCAQGFSISLLNVNSTDLLNYLNALTLAPGWPKSLEKISESGNVDFPITVPPSPLSKKIENPSNITCESSLMSPILTEKASLALKQIIIFAAEALISCERQLNIIDLEAGDGDAGTVLKKGAEGIKEAVFSDQMDLKKPSKFLHQLSAICCKCMGGLSGALYGVFFKAAAQTFESCVEITPEVYCTAFREALKSMKCYGKGELGDRTLLDVLCPALESFECALKHGKGLTDAVYLAATTCEHKSEETKFQQPSTLQFKNTRQPLLYADAGAHATTIWFRAITFDSDSPAVGPGVFLWRFLNEEESHHVLDKSLDSADIICFIETKIGYEQNLFTILLLEAVKFCRKEYEGSARKTSALVGTVYYTHCYFTASRWRTPAEVYSYFRESILRQSVQSPSSIEIFSPNEAKNALIFFFETYLRNLPIISILHFPHYKLQLRIKKTEEEPLTGYENEKANL